MFSFSFGIIGFILFFDDDYDWFLGLVTTSRGGFGGFFKLLIMNFYWPFFWFSIPIRSRLVLGALSGMTDELS